MSVDGAAGAVRSRNLGNAGKILRSRPPLNAAIPKANRHSSSNAGADVTLYPSVEAFLERQDYVDRGEVWGFDVVACRGNPRRSSRLIAKTRCAASVCSQQLDQCG